MAGVKVWTSSPVLTGDFFARLERTHETPVGPFEIEGTDEDTVLVGRHWLEMSLVYSEMDVVLLDPASRSTAPIRFLLLHRDHVFMAPARARR